MRKILLLLFVTILPGVSSIAQAQDKLLSILKQELHADMQELQKQQVKPYYMSLRVEDIYKTNVQCDFGDVSNSSDGRYRIVIPQIRLGDKQLDNFKFNTQGNMNNRGKGVQPTYLPVDDNAEEGIRAAIWKETLARYQFAYNTYLQTKTKASTTVADEDKASCFSDAPVEKYYEAPLDNRHYQIDRQKWEKRLSAVSAVFKKMPELNMASVILEYEANRVYFVNTDGTEVVQNRVAARVMIQAEVIAADGMLLPLMKDYFAYDIDSLPSEDQMISDARDMITRLKALRDAPVANPYTGPAILSGPASGVFFHEIFGHRLEGHRLKSGGETFKKMVGKKILPKEFNVYSDPTLRRYAGTDLNGFYLYDSEGVKARRVDNVVNGELKEFLMSRVPIDGFPTSNGHGRTSQNCDPVSRQSNLVIETSAPKSDAELRKLLIDEAKKQGKDYGYYFKTVTSGYTLTGEGGSLNSFNVTPIEVYRVFVDGRPDQLVRGVDLIGTPLAMFSNIAAGGKTASVFTGVCGAESGWVPVTASSPEIFVTQIETQRRQKSENIPPLLGAPVASTPQSTDMDTRIWTAMEEEIGRTKDSLQLENAPRPFYVSYITNRYRSIDIRAELGGITISKVTPWQMNGSSRVVVGNFKRNNELRGDQILSTGLPSVVNDDNFGLRRGFWKTSDMGYKYALNTYAQKMTWLNEHPLPKQLEEIPDMQRVAPGTYVENNLHGDYIIDEQHLKEIASSLSAVFKDFPELYNTVVGIDGNCMDVYRSTSERVRIKQHQGFIRITAQATFRDENGSQTSDVLMLAYNTPSEMPALDALKAKVRTFAEDMMALKKAPLVDEYYKGPLVYHGSAAASMFTETFLHANQFYAQQSLTQNPSSLGAKIGHKIIDPQLSIYNYSDMPTYAGTPLMGSYTIDADGIKPEAKMTIVENGIFKMMLNRCTPAEYATHSTGSARFGNNPRSAVPHTSVGTLHIKSNKPMNEEKMTKMLMKAAKKQKLDGVYIIDCPVGYSSLRVYRMDVKTGEKTLMRTNRLALPSMGQMESLLAVSSEENVVNMVGDNNFSVIYPSSVVIKEGELNKAQLNSEKAPVLTYPLQRK